MTKGFALVVLLASLFVAGAVVQDGGDLDRLAEASERGAAVSADGGQGKAGSSQRIAALNSAPSSSHVEPRRPRASSWDLQEEDDFDYRIDDYSSVETRRAPPRPAVTRVTELPHSGALSPEQLNLEQ